MYLVVLVGEASVGKTSLVNRFVFDKDPEPSLQSTIGVEFTKRTIVIDNQSV